VTVSHLVDVKELVVSYADGTVRAVDGITFSLNGGETLGLLGGNGAGKTSTMRVLAGVTPPTSGKVTVGDYSLSSPKGADAARQILGYCPDTAGLIRQATVREHIGLALGLHDRLERWPYALELVEKFRLDKVLDQETSGFSHGMSRRLSVVLAAITAERVLILDEPFDGVDPLGVTATESLIESAKNAGLAVLVSTHMIDLLSSVTDRIVVLMDGKIVDRAPSSAFLGQGGKTRYRDALGESRDR